MLVIQPTPFCNIDCDYCYLRHRAQRHVMAQATIETIAERIVARIAPDIDTLVVWHGGEPTTAHPPWFRHAHAALSARKRGTPLCFSIQTNGIGINPDWASFFHDTGTRVGLSIDGPQDLHDRHRRTRAGRPTWHHAIAALNTLREHGVEPGVITVLTADSLSRAADMLDFYAAHALTNISFSVEETEGANAASSLDGPGIETAVRDFLHQFLQGAIQREFPIHVREVERILSLMAAGATAAGSNEQTDPLAVLTIDWSGGVYTYSPEFTEHASGAWAHLRIGDINTQTMDEIIAGSAYARLVREVGEGLAACEKSCEFWRICGGGSPVNRLAEHGTLAVAETQFCRLTVQATAQVLARLLRTP